MINHAVLNMPSVIARDYLQNGFSAIPIGLLLAVINAWFLLSVYNRFPKFTMVEINRYLCGKYVGGFITILYITMIAISGWILNVPGIIRAHYRVSYAQYFRLVSCDFAGNCPILGLTT